MTKEDQAFLDRITAYINNMDLSSQAAAEKAAREQADTVDLGSLLKM